MGRRRTVRPIMWVARFPQQPRWCFNIKILTWAHGGSPVVHVPVARAVLKPFIQGVALRRESLAGFGKDDFCEEGDPPTVNRPHQGRPPGGCSARTSPCALSLSLSLSGHERPAATLALPLQWKSIAAGCQLVPRTVIAPPARWITRFAADMTVSRAKSFPFGSELFTVINVCMQSLGRPVGRHWGGADVKLLVRYPTAEDWLVTPSRPRRVSSPPCLRTSRVLARRRCSVELHVDVLVISSQGGDPPPLSL